MHYSVTCRVEDVGRMENVEVPENYPNIKLIKDIDDWNSRCFNYALKKSWIEACIEAMEILEEKYTRISIEEAKKGDIISYHDGIPDSENSLHFAIVYSTDNTIKGTMIKSKWGSMGIFLTTLDDVPCSYGNQVAIWRKRG